MNRKIFLTMLVAVLIIIALPLSACQTTGTTSEGESGAQMEDHSGDGYI